MPVTIIQGGELKDDQWSYLQEMLSKHIKKSGKYVLFNFYTTKPSVPVIYKRKEERALLVTKITHFCLLFSADKIPLLAIEIYTYCSFYKTHVERLVYVSKADTSGLDGSIDINVGQFVAEYMKWVSQIPIEKLISTLKFKIDNTEQTETEDVLKGNKKFVSPTHHALHVLEKRASGQTDYFMNKSRGSISALVYLESHGVELSCLKKENVVTRLVLFTRSEPHYLFPESMKNSGKHILDGSALLKWWLKNIDKITKDWTNCNRFLNILNSENREIVRYFPSESWKVGNVYNGTNEGTISTPAIYNVPLLPDDPKGRFLEHLIVEGRVKKVKCKQYWQELAIRQEFSFGAVVGLIGVAGIPSQFGTKITEDTFIPPKVMKQITDLITTRNYSDKSDWSLLYDELLDFEDLKHFDVIGSWEGRSSGTKRMLNETDSKPVVINTIMSVKSRKKSKQ